MANDDGAATFDCAIATGVRHVRGRARPEAAAARRTGLVDFKLMSISPAPAIRGNNSWIVQVATMTSGVVGDPVGSDATFVVTPYMPAHQHGTPVVVDITPESTAGSYQLSPVNLWMPGVWQTTIAVTRGGVTDSAVYSFCLND